MATAAKDRYGREIPAGCKDVKLSLGNAWRTTYTHIEAGDVVRIEQDRHSTATRHVASGTAAPKRSYWATVKTAERKGRVVRLTLTGGEITEEFPHTAITRQERETEYRARLDRNAAERAASVAEHAPVVENAPPAMTQEAKLAKVNRPSAERMAEIMPAASAPVWGTWKTHGKASLLTFHGRTLGYPRSGVPVRIETDGTGIILVTNLADGSVTRWGAAGRFYASPATPGEVSGAEVIVTSVPDTGYATAVARMIVKEGGYSAKEASELAERYAHLVVRGERFGSFTDYVAWEIMTAESKWIKTPTIDQPRDAAPVTSVPADLVAGHEAESHSRRGHECRICGRPVVDHEAVHLSDSVAVCWWMGAMYGQTMDPGLIAVRTAIIEARREADALAGTVTPQALAQMAANDHYANVTRDPYDDAAYRETQLAELAALPDVETQVGEIGATLADTARWSREKSGGRKARKGKRKAQKVARRISRKGH